MHHEFLEYREGAVLSMLCIKLFLFIHGVVLYERRKKSEISHDFVFKLATFSCMTVKSEFHGIGIFT